jgi:hypothetical protein
MEPYPGYDPNVDPRVSVEFATVGFSLSHSMVTSDVKFMDDKAFGFGGVRCAFPAPAVVYCGWCVTMRVHPVSGAHVYCCRHGFGLRSARFGGRVGGGGGFVTESHCIGMGSTLHAASARLRKLVLLMLLCVPC